MQPALDTGKLVLGDYGILCSRGLLAEHDVVELPGNAQSGSREVDVDGEIQFAEQIPR
ncbi:MAG: hypothetical protein ACKVX7_18825 [Planctomycetota bacterium]